MSVQDGRSTSESEEDKRGAKGQDRSSNKDSGGEGTRVVLCAVDASRHSKHAFDWYLANIWKANDLVIVFYCPEIPNLPYLSFKKGLSLPVDKWKGMMEEMHQKASKIEEEYELECRQRKLSYKLLAESDTAPGEGIVKAAEREKANMVVMGTRGMGAMKRLLLGSVSEYVLRHTPVPCVVIPAE